MNIDSGYLCKVIVVGEVAVGKSSIIRRYAHGTYAETLKQTIGVEFALKVLRLPNGSTVRVQLWDIGGQERGGAMTRTYYKDAVGALVVSDAARAETLEKAKAWKQDIEAKVKFPGSDVTHIPAFLLVNKSDLSDTPDVTLRTFCTENNFQGWCKTSAKDNTGIDEAIENLVKKIVTMLPPPTDQPPAPPQTVDLSKPSASTTSRCAC